MIKTLRQQRKQDIYTLLLRHIRRTRNLNSQKKLSEKGTRHALSSLNRFQSVQHVFQWLCPASGRLGVRIPAATDLSRKNR